MKNKDILFFGLVIICIVAVFMLLSFMKAETTQCVKNPFVYGADSMKGIDCYCQQLKDDSDPSYFRFNDTHLISDSKFYILEK